MSVHWSHSGLLTCLDTKPNIGCIDVTQYPLPLQAGTVSLVHLPALSLNSVSFIYIIYPRMMSPHMTTTQKLSTLHGPIEVSEFSVHWVSAKGSQEYCDAHT